MRTATLLLLALLSRHVQATTIVAGTEISVRLKTKVGSKVSKAGDPVQAEVIAPVRKDSRIIVWPGTLLNGTVKTATPAPSATERAALLLDFTSLADTSGNKANVKTIVAGVDNAREKVDGNGNIQGIVASETYSAKLDQEIGRKWGGFLENIKKSLLQEPDSEIFMDVGVELTVRVTASVDWNGAPGPAVWEPAAPPQPLVDLVNAQPFQTIAEKPPKPSDITNLMFLGTREQIEAAFQAAGWTLALNTNRDSGFETFRALVEDRGYKEAPMSSLLLDGRKSDMNWEKQYDTFARRHHLRIFSRPAGYNGVPVWVASSTHDNGISFSQQDRTFIHRVISRIDDERDKVVSDLTYTGKVQAVYYVDRPAVPKQLSNATGDSLATDGRMAVIAFDNQ
ncbi:MAG: LssY C-terminal domain-containing protein [Bryobacterales bacterium]|nr:LssY C-terminal domain-containing protein [Bryobacterales bacterium]